jgi:hypothetical protein
MPLRDEITFGFATSPCRNSEVQLENSATSYEEVVDSDAITLTWLPSQ